MSNSADTSAPASLPENPKPANGNDDEAADTTVNSGKQPEDGSAEDNLSGPRWALLFAVGALILVGFIALIIYMLAAAPKTSSTETIWDRDVYIFGAGQAIAFTAVGWLFGREVNRTAVKSAEKGQPAPLVTRAKPTGKRSKPERNTEQGGRGCERERKG